MYAISSYLDNRPTNKHSHTQTNPQTGIRYVFSLSSIKTGFRFFIDAIGNMFPWWSSVMD